MGLVVKRFRFFKAKDEEVNALSRNVMDFVSQLYNVPILDGLLIEGVELDSATSTIVNHGLGRAIRGWIIVKQDASSSIYALEVEQSTPLTTLVLKCSADVKVSLWVF